MSKYIKNADAKTNHRKSEILFFSAIAYQLNVRLEWLYQGIGAKCSFTIMVEGSRLSPIKIYKQSEMFIDFDNYLKMHLHDDLCIKLTKYPVKDVTGIITETSMQGVFQDDSLILVILCDSFSTPGLYVIKKKGKYSFINIRETYAGYQISFDGTNYDVISENDLSKMTFARKAVWNGKKI